MASYHLEHKIIGRTNGRSFARTMSYIRGEKLRDEYACKTYYHYRSDVLWTQIFLPQDAPKEYRIPQVLCSKIEKAERRSDARTAREFIGALPNELPLKELKRIIYEFVVGSFIKNRLCAVVAIREGKSLENPAKDNPHVHILLSTRPVGPAGFENKYRELDKKASLILWREQWARVQNDAYKRYGLDVRVSHESLKIQGKDMDPLPHLNHMEWQREQRGEHTPTGDQSAIQQERKKSVRSRELERTREMSLERGRHF